MRGGYKIINFKNVPLETGGATMMVDGIYEEIEGNHHKAIMISNLVLDGIEINETFVNPIIAGATFRLPLNNNKSIIITDADAVSVVNG